MKLLPIDENSTCCCTRVFVRRSCTFLRHMIRNNYYNIHVRVHMLALNIKHVMCIHRITRKAHSHKDPDPKPILYMYRYTFSRKICILYIYTHIYILIYIWYPPVIYLFWGRLRKCLGFRAEVGQSALLYCRFPSVWGVGSGFKHTAFLGV